MKIFKDAKIKKHTKLSIYTIMSMHVIMNSDDFDGTSNEDIKAMKHLVNEGIRGIAEYNDKFQKAWKRDIQFALENHAWSKAAYEAYLKGEILKLESGKSAPLHVEHIVPCNVLFLEVIQRYLDNGQMISQEELEEILLEGSRIIILTKAEANLLDTSIKNGGLGLQSKMPEGCTSKNLLARLEAAGIELHPETINNYLK